jgi:V8-like Glu-specific endopeptidase
LLLACSNDPWALESTNLPLLYGEDTRRDLYEAQDEVHQSLMAESALALFDESSLLRHEDGSIDYVDTPLDEFIGLCPDERFREQPAAALCSGTLITDSLLLTAGHCIRSTAFCAEQTWAFGYSVTAPGAPPQLRTSDLYRCKSVPVCAHRTDPDGRRWDFAFVELERPVSPPRRPAPMDLDGLTVGSHMEVIGFPSGLPVKIDEDAKVLDTRASFGDYFALGSDTYDRSSGSGVFDAEGVLRGVFQRGAEDYVYREELDCFTSQRVSESVDPARTEQAGYLGPALALLCRSGFNDDRICASASRFNAPVLATDTCAPPSPSIQHSRASSGAACAVAPPSSRSPVPPGCLGLLLGLGLWRGLKTRPFRGHRTRALATPGCPRF